MLFLFPLVVYLLVKGRKCSSSVHLALCWFCFLIVMEYICWLMWLMHPSYFKYWLQVCNAWTWSFFKEAIQEMCKSCWRGRLAAKNIFLCIHLYHNFCLCLLIPHYNSIMKLWCIKKEFTACFHSLFLLFNYRFLASSIHMEIMPFMIPWWEWHR